MTSRALTRALCCTYQLRITRKGASFFHYMAKFISVFGDFELVTLTVVADTTLDTTLVKVQQFETCRWGNEVGLGGTNRPLRGQNKRTSCLKQESKASV